MIAGYGLAIVPTWLVLAGAAVSIRRLIKKPQAEWILLMGFSGLVILAMVFMCLKVASYAQMKAFYGLCALVPFCALGATGWEVLTRERRWLRLTLGMLLLVWAMNSFASFWICGGRRGSAGLSRCQIPDRQPGRCRRRRIRTGSQSRSRGCASPATLGPRLERIGAKSGGVTAGRTGGAGGSQR